MKNHTFPTIRNITDVLPFIEGVDEFKVIRKDWYTVINYVVALEDTFPSIEVAGGSAKMRKERQLEAAMRRECRGLVFDNVTGELLSRPYHKFFNVNEKPETHVNKVNLATPHVILEKLDGCCEANTELITPEGIKTIKDVCDSQYRGLVLGYDHKNKEYCWTPVLSHSEKLNRDDWYEVELETGDKITLTSNHKVWCVNKAMYLELKNLSLEDEVLLVA
jgi:tRNA splicing ligase